MCGLCSPQKETKENEIASLNSIGRRLHRLADAYQQLAKGTIKPHTKEWTKHKITVFSIIRILVDD